MKQSSKVILIALLSVALGLLIGSRAKLFDKTPPVLSSESWLDHDCAAVHPEGDAVHHGAAPEHPVFGRIEVFYVVRDADNGVYVGATLDGEKVDVDRMEEDAAFRLAIDADALTEGEHVLDVDIHDQSFRANAIPLTRTFVVDRTPPVIALAESSKQAGQGTTAAIFVRSSEPLHSLTGNLEEGALRAFVDLDAGLTWRTLTGIGVKQVPGETDLELSAVDLAGHQATLGTELSVTLTDFPEGGFIKLSPKKQSDMKNREKSKESNRRRSAAYSTLVDLPVPTELFITPVDGRLSSPFGKVRRYNTGVVRHHLGTDLAAPRGTPVKSAAPGTVVLAELLHIYGNAVIVNHADGVSTSYNHLSRIDVAPGDTVAAGDVLGAVGSTGQSTGPHLHWGMVVDGSAVAPEQWTLRTFAAPLPGDFE